MTEPTDRHLDLATTVLVAVTETPFPAHPAPSTRRARQVIAQAIADAEQRGPAGGRDEPTAAEERAFRHGLERGFTEALAAVAAAPVIGAGILLDHIRARAHDWGIDLP